MTQPPLSLRSRTSRSVLARSRLEEAVGALAECRLCEHHCGVNRLQGELGYCKADATASVFSAQVEVSDELQLIPVFAVAFSGCDLRCDFCITGKESWNPRAGRALPISRIAQAATRALDERRARTIMVLGGEPTIHLPTVIDLVSQLPDDAHLIWKTNGHGSVQSRRLLEGLFDTWVVDYKFGNDRCAWQLAKCHHYNEIVTRNLRWASQNSELIVRHLLMPGHLECCWLPVARWLGEHLPGVKVNLRTGFWPAWKARRHSSLCNPISGLDEARALQIAELHRLRLIE